MVPTSCTEAVEFSTDDPLNGIWQFDIKRDGQSIAEELGYWSPNLMVVAGGQAMILRDNMAMAIGKYRTDKNLNGLAINLQMRPPAEFADIAEGAQFWFPKEFLGRVKIVDEDIVELTDEFKPINPTDTTKPVVTLRLERLIPANTIGLPELAVDPEYFRQSNAILTYYKWSTGESRLPLDARRHADVLDSLANLRHLVLATHNYHDKHKSLPASAAGTPSVSWRVAILPYLGHQQLYDQYRFDEPWDSQHNKKLLSQMPDVFRHPSQAKGTANTCYVGIVGGDTAMGETEGISLENIQDGTSNTILLVESKTEIPWTKPEDLQFTSGGPLPTIQPVDGQNYNAGFADSSAYTLPVKSTDKNKLRAMITSGGGETYRIPKSRK